MPHLALFVRDALGLPIPAAPEVPPRLLEPPPDRLDLLSDDERQVAGQDWALWWTTVLRLPAPSMGADPGQGLEAWRARQESAGTPPAFEALADRAALHRVVVQAFPQAHGWVNRLDRGVGGGRTGWFPFELVRQVAEDVAFDRSVDVGDVRASAQLLAVEGNWWQLIGPGTAVCSVGAASEPAVARQVLRQAFVSGLPR